MGAIGKTQAVEITEEIKKSYLDYAMSVIVARALPDVRDGLKPVHRRILYTMQQMGLSWPSRFTKAAKIVGETLGKYHPHGDMSVYDSLVRLAQDFSMRYPLVSGQGNFGSVDGDPPAAMRYTEARLASITSEMLADLEKNTVEWRDNFDGTLKEPDYLPTKLPNLLLMGSEGIAVGMATKIPPHNLKEVVDALVFTIDKGKVISPKAEKKNFEIKKIDLTANPPTGGLQEVSFDSPVTIEELMQFIKGPDFPTGATIWNYQDIFQVYATGRGRILIRAIADIEDSGSKTQIIISKIPYQVNKAALVAHIAHLARDKKIEGIADLRDESDRQGLRIVLDLKKSAKPKVILNNLYKHTAMQTVYPVNTVVLVDGTPQTLNLKQILLEFIKHRQKIVVRRTIFDLDAARARAHILEGLKIALDNLDAVIQTIKRSADEKDAKINLMAKFSLSDLQATAILEMQLRRLAALERKKIEDEYTQVEKLIAWLTDLLASPKKVLKIIKEELLKIKDQYGDERKTKVYRQKVGEFSEKDLVPNELCLITVTRTGYIKRLAPITYRSQRRGGKGVAGMTTKETDEVKTLLSTNTHDQILFFTNKGRVFAMPAWEIPEASRISKGQAIINLINVGPEEEIQAVLNLPEDFKSTNTRHLLMVTKKGVVKKTNLAHFQNIRSSGLIAIKLEKDDELCWVKQTAGDNHVLLVTHFGKSIRFHESDVRPTGRDTIGVRGIRLQKDDCVIGLEVFDAKPPESDDKRRKFFRDVLVVMEKGVGKRTGIRSFPLQKRGGIGVKVAHVTPKTGQIIVSQFVDQDTDLVVLTSKKAQLIKLPLKNIPRLGRDTQGVILMRFSKTDDHVAAVTCMGK